MSQSLLDIAHVATLGEAEVLSMPPARDPNRLVAGWKPDRSGRGVRPTFPESSIELASVVSRPRPLEIEVSFPDHRPGDDRGEVEVLLGDELLARATLEPITRLVLPPLPSPAAPVLRLRFDGRPRPRVDAVRIDAVVPPGPPLRRDGGLVHSAAVALDLVARTPAGGRVRARASATRGRPRARAVLTTEAGQRRGMPAVEASADGAGADLTFEASVPPGAFRLVLSAEGEVGDVVRWSDLVLDEERIAPPRERVRESSASARPSGSAGRPRLVLVVVFDALRSDALDDRTTPTLTRLGREGRTWTLHRSVAPNTLPSTAALFFGRPFPRVLEPGDLAQTGPSLASHYRDAGFETALFSANVYVSATFHMTGGFDHVAPIPAAPVVEANRSTGETFRALLEWWASRSEPSAPAFVYVHVLNPHNPFLAPEPFGSHGPDVAGTPALVEILEGRRRADSATADAIREAYRESVAYADSELGKLLEALLVEVPRDELLVVLTSDHGEELLEPGLGLLHGHTLAEEAVRVPWIVWPPETVGSGETDRPTTTVDVHRFLARVATGEDPRATLDRIPVEGTDRPTLLRASSVPHGILAGTDGRWKVVLTGFRGDSWGTGAGAFRRWDVETVHDLSPGADAARDVLARVDDPAVEWLRREVRSAVERDLEAAGDAAGVARPEAVPAAVAAELEALGYR